MGGEVTALPTGGLASGGAPLPSHGWPTHAAAAPETRAPLPTESIALALRLEDPRLVQRVLPMLVDEQPPVPPELLAPLTGHPSLEVRLTAVAVLSRWHDASSRSVLSQFLGDPSVAVRDRVLRAIEGGAGRWTPTAATAALQAENDAGLARRMAELVARQEPAMAVRVLQRIAAVLVSSKRSSVVLGEVLQVLRRFDEVTWQRLVAHVPAHLVPPEADAARREAAPVARRSADRA